MRIAALVRRRATRSLQVQPCRRVRGQTGNEGVSEFAQITCSAPADRSERMCDLVMKHVPGDQPLQVLDVGCGTGSLVFLMARALPHATLVGLDVSAANVRAAEAHRTTLDSATAVRMRFEQGDYLVRPAAPVDAVTSDGVLHLIPATRARCS